MRRILLVLFFLPIHFAFAQSFELSDYSIDTYKAYFKRASSTSHFWNEIPPWTIKGEWHQYFFTTHFTTMWSSPSSMATPKDDYFFVGERQGSSPSVIVSSSHWWDKFYDPDFLSSSVHIFNREWESHHWRRNYNGVFSAHVINHAPSKQNLLFAISHGENKNEKIEKYLYQNSVRTDFIINETDPLTYSGGKPYKDCWEAYFGFLNGNWSNYNDRQNSADYMNDLGPIAWPSAGYLKPNGEQASKGLRHPSSIVHDNYLYIYVIDESMDGTGGVKLVRAHTNDILQPSAYETWSSEGWIPSLPTGFSKNQITDYFNKRGPNNTPVFTPDKNTIRFSVAKIKGTAKFIGVEEYIVGWEDNTIKVAFRLSDDLINWSDRIEFYTNESWGSSELRYPIFLNSEGTTNTEIDLEEFYVIGSSSSGAVTKYHFNLAQPVSSLGGSSGNSFSAGFVGNNRIEAGKALKEIEFQISPVPAYYTIDFKIKIASPSAVGINLYDSKGVIVRTLLNEVFEPQLVTKTFDVSNLQAGVYIVEVIQNKERQFQRIVKL